jgi:hypothetical protein
MREKNRPRGREEREMNNAPRTYNKVKAKDGQPSKECQPKQALEEKHVRARVRMGTSKCFYVTKASKLCSKEHKSILMSPS